MDSKVLEKIKISTHTPHARRDPITKPCSVNDLISTHTPHARRDLYSSTCKRQERISTHTPHARRDGFADYIADWLKNFYSHASCEA